MGRYMGHENEYHDNMVRMLGLIWGEGSMAPGGRGNVVRPMRGIDAAGERLLDIGCGIGGPAFDMARMHGAIVTGIDLEAPLIERAQQRAERLGLDGTTRFQ
ncbi:MAG: methyltransferase domain-containing protein [Gammaproteobacteria bacterium]|nr:methyltransferase domain-containing protein [Gammaproteobacteria bacterium]